MGKLRDIINSVDNSAAITEDIKENLHILMSLADSKVQQFSDEIVIDLKNGKTTDDLSVPITKVTHKYLEARAITKDTTTDVLQEIGNTINSVISDHSASGIVSGIASLAHRALDTVMGTGEGTEQEVRLYTVSADYPAIVRFDFAFWARNIQAASIKNHCETALACVMYKSAVDISKLAFNDFLSLYAPILNAGYGSDPSQMEQMIDKSQKIYRRFLQAAQPDLIANDMNEVTQNSRRLLRASGAQGLDNTLVDMGQAMRIVKTNSKLRGIVLSPSVAPTRGEF